MGQARFIIHIDMDAFYAAIEARDHPQLRGLPLVVGGSPQSRSVVCSASYEARAFGVRSAMACAQAQRLCPQAVFVEPDFRRYEEASRHIQAIFYSYTDLVEPLSLDEAYLDVSEHVSDEAGAREIAETIRARIRAETGLTASAGVAPNKFLAKVASDRNKPNGLCQISSSEARDFIRTLPVETIPGVGRVTAAYCHRIDIRLVGDFLRLTDEELHAHFGRSGEHFRELAQGIDDSPVCPEREAKSIGAEETFATDLVKKVEILAHLRTLADRLEERLRSAGMRGRTLTLKVKYHDFKVITRRRTFSEPQMSAAAIMAAAEHLAESTAIGVLPIRLLGLSCSQLDASGAVQELIPLWAN
jgi:DNA polymerase IV